MVSSKPLNLIFFIFCINFIHQCKTSDERNGIATIPLSQLFHELLREPYPGLFNAHMTAMFSIASYGHRLYALSKEISPECSQTAIATSIMLKNLTKGFHVMELMEEVMEDLNHEDLRLSIFLQEHPVELVCRKVEKFFNGSPLIYLFENSKREAANVKTSYKPPYSLTIITSQETLNSLQKDWYDHAEWAEEWVLVSFYAQMDVLTGDPEMLFLAFAESVVRLAKKGEFADSLQSLFLRAIKDVLPQITESPSEIREDFFWVRNLMEVFYGHIAKDPILKKELDNMALIFSHGEMTLDELDVSKKNLHSEL